MDYGVENFNALKEEQNEYKELMSGDRLPNFEIIDIDGNLISSEMLQGKKTIIVATNASCGNCIEHTHKLMSL